MTTSIPTPNGDDEPGAQVSHGNSGSGTPPPSVDLLATLFTQGGPGPASQSATDEPPVEVVKPSPETPPGTPVTPETPKPDAQAEATAALARAAEALATRAATPAPAPAPAPQPEAPKGPKVWASPEQVPAAMQALLHSEDPAERMKGIVVLMNAFTNMVYDQVRQDVETQYQPQFQGFVQDYWQQQKLANDFRQDLQTNYPVFTSSEAGKLVAQHVFQQVSQEFVAAGKKVNWFDPEYKKAIDAKLKLLNIDPKLGVVPQSPPPPPPPAPTPVARSSGARPVDPTPGTQTQQDHMMSMLATVMPQVRQ